MKPTALLAAVLSTTLLCSGCVNTSVLGGDRPEDIVKGFEQVRDFLANHPDSDLEARFIKEGYIRSHISEFAERCGPYFKIADHWRVVFTDTASGSSLTIWLEGDNDQLACLYGEGVDSPPPYVPGPVKSDLTITGFPKLQLDEAGTEFYGSRLYLDIGNPNAKRIIIKRVTASYLDDILVNMTTSGLVDPGDSFEYGFGFSRTIDGGPFWIDVEILYDIPASFLSNQISSGSVISGLDTSRIIQCSEASFEVTRYSYLVGARVLSIDLQNTGGIDLRVRTLIRNETGDIVQALEPSDLSYRGSRNLEVPGLNRGMQSIILVSEACPGANEVIFVEDIPGL